MEVLLIVKQQAEVYNFTKISTPAWVLFKFIKLYNRYQIVQSITSVTVFWNIFLKIWYRNSHRKFSLKNVLKIFAKFTGKRLCQSLFNKVVDLSLELHSEEKALAQMISCEFCCF